MAHLGSWQGMGLGQKVRSVTMNQKTISNGITTRTLIGDVRDVVIPNNLSPE
jgi:hypothetical protein